MKKLLIFLSMVFLLSLLSACSIADALSGLGDSDETQVVQSAESDLSLEVPKAWKSSDLHDEASIQMANLLKEQYLIVLEEPTVDFTDDFTLEDYTSIIMTNMMESVDVSDSSDVKDITIGTATNAKQFEISASVDNVKITYLITCAEANGLYYQFTAWTLPSKYEEAKPVFDKVLDSADFSGDAE